MKKLIALILCVAILPIFAVAKDEFSYEVIKTVLTEDFEDYVGDIPLGFKAVNAKLSAKDGGVLIPSGSNLKKSFLEPITSITVIEADIKSSNGEKFLFNFGDSLGAKNKGIQISPKGSVNLFTGNDDWSTKKLKDKYSNGKYTIIIDSMAGTVSAGIDGVIILENMPFKNDIVDISEFEFVNQSGNDLIVDNITVSLAKIKGGIESIVDTQNYIFMQAGNSSAYHRDNKIPINVINSNVRVISEGEVVYAPLKFFNECYEIPLTWNTDENYAKFRTDKDVIVKADSEIIIKDAKEYKFDHKTKIIDGILYISIPMAERIYNKYSAKSDTIIMLSDAKINVGAISDKINMIKIELSGNDIQGKFETLDLKKAEPFLEKNILDKAWLSGDSGSKKQVEVSDMPFTTAWSLDTAQKPVGDYWTYKYAMPTSSDIKEGDVCLLTFYARATRVTDESANAQTEVVVEQNHNPWGKSLTLPLAITSKWQKFYVPFIVRIDHLSGKTELNFRLGYRPQTIEIAELEGFNFKNNYSLIDMPTTRTTYKGREVDAPWREKAINDIADVRVNKTVVKVVDEKGNPVKNAQVNFEMDEHIINFGTSVSQWHITGQNVNATEKGREDVKKYRETTLKYFNTAVPENALKWVLWEDGRKSNSRMCVDWLNHNGIRVKGHAFYWDNKDYSPKGIREIAQSNPLEFNEIVKKYIYDMAYEFKDQIAEWDCLNEPSQSRNLLNSLGEDYIKGWFESAKKAIPNTPLYVNEMQIIGDDSAQYAKFKQIVGDMVKNEVPFDGIGLQGHFGSIPASPEAFLSQLDYFSKVGNGKKVAVTEYDMMSPDESVQADFLRDLLIACYSHPSLSSFIMWGHWDNDHWRRNSPTFRSDWTMKPAGQMWYRLTQFVWNTNVCGTTDINGEYLVNAYDGNYLITVTVNGKKTEVKKTITQDGEIIIII